MRFKKIEEIKKATSAVSQILSNITNGDLEVGSQLPSERTLAEEMGISRNSVREALSILQALDVVERKTGSGTYVRCITGLDFGNKKRLKEVKETEDLLEIWEARKEIEQSLVQFAIDRASNEELAKLAKPLEAMRRAMSEQDFVGYLNADDDFHLFIAKCATNSPLEKALLTLKKSISYELVKIRSMEYTRTFADECFSDHERLFRALENRDGRAASREVADHLDKLGSFLEQRLKNRKGEL